jgi:hypothetical protein
MEDSPECLAHYRGVYNDDMMEKHGAETRLGASINLCRISLITENLAHCIAKSVISPKRNNATTLQAGFVGYASTGW